MLAFKTSRKLRGRRPANYSCWWWSEFSVPHVLIDISEGLGAKRRCRWPGRGPSNTDFSLCGFDFWFCSAETAQSKPHRL